MSEASEGGVWAERAAVARKAAAVSRETRAMWRRNVFGNVFTLNLVGME